MKKIFKKGTTEIVYNLGGMGPLVSRYSAKVLRSSTLFTQNQGAYRPEQCHCTGSRLNVEHYMLIVDFETECVPES